MVRLERPVHRFFRHLKYDRPELTSLEPRNVRTDAGRERAICTPGRGHVRFHLSRSTRGGPTGGKSLARDGSGWGAAPSVLSALVVELSGVPRPGPSCPVPGLRVTAAVTEGVSPRAAFPLLGAGPFASGACLQWSV